MSPSKRFVRRSVFVACAVAIALLISSASSTVTAQSAPRSGGNGTLYYGTYDKKIYVIDEATLAIRDSMPVADGIPLGMVLSDDRTKMYTMDAARQFIEMFDLTTHRSINRFSLTEGARQVRIDGFNVDPADRYAILLVKTAQKGLDRWEIGKNTLLKYDFASKQVTDTIAWPDGQEREFAQILFSPDGKSLYFFTDEDILIYDASTLKQVDKWDLQRSVDEGLGRLNFGFPRSVYEDRGFSTGLFRTSDPINRRTLMGVARVDLANRTVDFYSLGPSEGVGFTLAPGRRKAYGLRQQVGNYQFWVYDLENRRVERRVEFDGRPRMGLSVSTNGSLLYVHTAGATIDVYDAETLQFVRTATYRADMTGLVIVPRP